MKKIISIVVLFSLLMLPFVASADYSNMSDEELFAELNLIRAEITKRAEMQDSKIVLASADGVTVTLKGEPELKTSYDGSHYLVLNVTVINSSENAVGIRTDDCYVNGWKIYASFQTSLDAGTKCKATIVISNVDEEAEVESLEDLEDIKLVFLTFDGNTYRTKTKDIAITIAF